MKTRPQAGRCVVARHVVSLVALVLLIVVSPWTVVLAETTGSPTGQTFGAAQSAAARPGSASNLLGEQGFGADDLRAEDGSGAMLRASYRQVHPWDDLDGLAIEALPSVHAERGAIGSVRVRDVETGAVWLHLRSERRNDLFGYATAWVGDLDGDGWPELAVAAPNAADPTTLERRGVVRIVSGLDGSTVRTIEGRSGEVFGTSLVVLERAGSAGDGAGLVLGVLGSRLDGPGGVRSEERYFDLATGEPVDVSGDVLDVLQRRTHAEWLGGGVEGDLNGDLAVDLADMQVVLDEMGRSLEAGADAAMQTDPLLALGLVGDVNGDGVVDEDDVTTLGGLVGSGGLSARTTPVLPPGCFWPCGVINVPPGPVPGGDPGAGATGTGGGGPSDTGTDNPDGSQWNGGDPDINCLCASFRFDPDGENPPPPLYVLPGDARSDWKPDFSLGSDDCNYYPGVDEVEFFITGEGAKFLIEKEGEEPYFADSVSMRDSWDASVAGLKGGNAHVNVRIKGVNCMAWGSRLEVRVGGSIRVWVDQMPTFQVSTSRSVQHEDRPDFDRLHRDVMSSVVNGQAGYGSRSGGLVVGGGSYWEGGRFGMPSEVIERTNTVPALRSRMVVRVLNSDGDPMPNHPVRMASRFGLFTEGDGISTPGARAIITSTDENGYTIFNVGAHAPTAEAIWAHEMGGDPARFGEASGVVDRVGLTYGRGATGFASIRSDAKQEGFTSPDFVLKDVGIGSFGVTGDISLKEPVTADPEGFFGVATFDHLAINHSHAMIIQDNIISKILPDPTAHVTHYQVNVQLEDIVIEEQGAITISLSPSDYYDLSDPAALLREGFLATTLIPAGVVFDLTPLEDPNMTLGESTTLAQDLWWALGYSVRLAGKTLRDYWEIPAGFLPGWDLVDLIKEVYIKPLSGEDPNYLVVGLSALGLIMDAGYILGPVGFAGNLGVAILKKCAKLIDEDLFRVLVTRTNRIIDAALDLVRYVARIAEETQWAVQQTVDRVGSTLRAMRLGATETADDAVGSLARAVRVSGGCAVDAFRAAAVSRSAARSGGCNSWNDDGIWRGLGRLMGSRYEDFALRIIDDFGEEVAGRTFKHCQWVKFDDAGTITDEAIDGMARILRTIGETNDDVKLFLQGSRVLGIHQNLALRNLGAMEAVEDMPFMLANVRANSNNGPAIIGAVYESTAAYRCFLGHAPIGQPTRLSRLYDDTVQGGVLYKIDFVTNTYAVQVKHTLDDVLSPSAIKGKVGGQRVSGRDYLVDFVAQCELLGIPPCLISNVPARADTLDLCNDLEIRYIIIPSELTN